MPAISASEHAACEAAFDAAQARTSAPLSGVVVSASSDYVDIPVVTTLIVALAAPWPLLLFTEISAERIFAAQMFVALVMLAGFSFARIRMALTPGRARRGFAHRAALVQFALRGGEHAPRHNAVLIYVSLGERYARIVAGDAANASVSAAQWQGLVAEIVARLADGKVVEAMTVAAQRSADMLAPHFPPSPGVRAKGARFHSA